MSKQFTKILIMTIIFSIISVFLYLAAVITCENNEAINDTSANIKEDFEEAFEDDEIDDVEGYGLIVEGGVLGLIGVFGFLAIFVLGLVVPISTLSGMVICQIAARLFQIGENKKWKNITSTVLTILSLIANFLTLIVFFYVAIVFNFNILICVIIILLNIIYGYKVIKELKNRENDIVEVV